jgi:hypothetical protein
LVAFGRGRRKPSTAAEHRAFARCVWLRVKQVGEMDQAADFVLSEGDIRPVPAALQGLGPDDAIEFFDVAYHRGPNGKDVIRHAHLRVTRPTLDAKSQKPAASK